MDEKRKFIGGAEKARRLARNRARQPFSKKGKQTHRFKNLKPSQKFFYSLLASDVQSYINSNHISTTEHIEKNNFGKRKRSSHYDELISEICQRGNAPLPRKITATYADKNEFYAIRKALVLEEARCILSNELEQLSKRGRWSMRLSLVSSVEQPKTGIPILEFMKAPMTTHNRKYSSKTAPTRFTNAEMYYMKPGCVFELSYVGNSTTDYDAFTPENGNYCTQSSILATILPINRNSEKSAESESTFSLMVFHKDIMPNKIAPNTLWNARPVTTLIGEQRQFEACDRGIKVSFMPKILGWNESSHIRFSDSDQELSDEEEKKDDDETKSYQISNCDGNLSGDPFECKSHFTSSYFSLPALNQTQNRALLTFLKSQESTITLVQGPPGTGKTTFLAHAICRTLLDSTNETNEEIIFDTSKRILVTAPTNKAITVIASRLLDSLPREPPINVVMIGVEDKLVPNDEFNSTDRRSTDDHFSISSLSSRLRSVFVYTWIESMISSYRSLDEKITVDTDIKEDIDEILIGIQHLENKLLNSIPKLARQSCVNDASSLLMATLTSVLEIAQNDSNDSDVEKYLRESKMHLKEIVKRLSSMNPAAVVQELLFTANLIFCTLSSSGVSAMKMTSHVDDLFVDEAAAATEAEICIPFHLRPKRMLAVGDPMQLPATIISRRAMELGLDKSLHERLMSECNTDHIMLDVQYRMKPEISSFPSKQFYNGQIMNGENVMRSDYKSQTQVLGGKPYTFIQVSGKEQRSESGSFFNETEAQIVAKLLQMIKSSAKNEDSNESWYSAEKIRVITFYQGQVQRIKSLLNRHKLGRVLVATVDSSQGCEADIVIVSFVRSNDKSGSSLQRTGFLTDARRMNVALTRAKYQLICIGDGFGTLACSGDTTLKAIVDDAKIRSRIKQID